jgi:putative membrane protein insertion efficiency factor
MPFKKSSKSKESSEVTLLHQVDPAKILTAFGRGIDGLLIVLIKVYQLTLRSVFPPSCRFSPSCSEYAVSALKKFGALKGGWLSVKRLTRCHPFNPGGYDPLP